MQIDEISKGGKIELEIKVKAKSMFFQSTILLTKNNSILISPIKINEQTLGFSDKYIVNLIYKMEDKLYLWENVKVTLVKYNDAIFHRIELDGEGTSYNRRSAYRIYIGENMSLHVNTATGPTSLTVLIKDISETGVAFITKEEFKIGSPILLKLTHEGKEFHLSGHIVRKEVLEHIKSQLYGCQFKQHNPMLSKYIAKKQGDSLRKNKS